MVWLLIYRTFNKATGHSVLYTPFVNDAKPQVKLENLFETKLKTENSVARREVNPDHR